MLDHENDTLYLTLSGTPDFTPLGEFISLGTMFTEYVSTTSHFART